MFRNFKRSLTVLVILILAASTYAFAASNTIAPSTVGYASTSVAGYTVSNIVYDLDDDSATLVHAINFDIDPTVGTLPAAVVMIQTANGAAPWKVCTLSAGTAPTMHVACSYPGGSLTVAAIAALNVTASSTTNPVGPAD